MTTGLPVGVVGPGVMGSAMSAHLLAAGFPVLGFDVDARRTAEHAERGGAVCGSPAEVAAGAEIVVTSLPGAGPLSGVLDGLRGGARGVSAASAARKGGLRRLCGLTAFRALVCG
ncbi:NAD(P)-binding domain-containing protein [Pseudonocardia sp. DLS-67]